MMESGNTDKLEKDSYSNAVLFDCDVFYKILTKRVSETDMQLWFGESTRISENNGNVRVEGLDRFYTNWIKDHYNTVISEILEEFGFNGEVNYDVDLRLDPSPQMSLDFENSRPTKKKKDLVALCSRYSYLDGPFYDGAKIIFHGGNRPVYREIDFVLESLKKSVDYWEPLIVHGKNGLGKTHAMNYLLHKARKRKIPAVGFNLNSLVNYLNPQLPNKANELKAFEAYNLAKDYAKLVVVDQAHSMIGGNGPNYYHRKGTQSWMFALETSVKDGGGNLVYAFTDTRGLPLEKAVDMLMDENIYMVKNEPTVGNRDLGDRIKNHLFIEIGSIPVEEQWEVINGIAGGDGLLTAGGMSSEQISETISAANYGEKTNIRGIAEKVKNIVRASRAYDVPVTRELIMKVAGSKKAKKKFALGGFDFHEKSDHDSGSFLDDYSIDDIDEIMLSHLVFKKIPLDKSDSELIRKISARWLSQGGDKNSKADGVLRLRDGNSSSAEFNAMEKLFSGYREYKSLLF